MTPPLASPKNGVIKKTTPSLDSQAAQLVHYLDTLVHHSLDTHFPKPAQIPDINPADFRAMAILEQAGAITMSDFAQQLNLPLSTATNRVERLVKLGLASRGRSESDRRIVEVSLSPKGRQLVTIGHQVRLSMGRGMLSSLTPAERLTFLELMQKMSNNVTR